MKLDGNTIAEPFPVSYSLSAIIKLEHKIAYLETTIKYIDGVLRSIQSRGWDIKNAISWKQFEAGMS